MKYRMLLLLYAVMGGLVSGAPQEYDIKRYEHLDLDVIFNNQRMVKYYANCLLAQGPCPPQGLEMKQLLPEALATNCAKCPETFKGKVYRAIKKLKTEYPETWQELEAKWDPDGSAINLFERSYEAKLQNSYEFGTNSIDNTFKSNKVPQRPPVRSIPTSPPPSNVQFRSPETTVRPTRRPFIVTTHSPPLNRNHYTSTTVIPSPLPSSLPSSTTPKIIIPTSRNTLSTAPSSTQRPFVNRVSTTTTTTTTTTPIPVQYSTTRIPSSPPSNVQFNSPETTVRPTRRPFIVTTHSPPLNRHHYTSTTLIPSSLPPATTTSKIIIPTSKHALSTAPSSTQRPFVNRISTTTTTTPIPRQYSTTRIPSPLPSSLPSTITTSKIIIPTSRHTFSTAPSSTQRPFVNRISTTTTTTPIPKQYSTTRIPSPRPSTITTPKIIIPTSRHTFSTAPNSTQRPFVNRISTTTTTTPIPRQYSTTRIPSSLPTSTTPKIIFPTSRYITPSNTQRPYVNRIFTTTTYYRPILQPTTSPAKVNVPNSNVNPIRIPITIPTTTATNIRIISPQITNVEYPIESVLNPSGALGAEFQASLNVGTDLIGGVVRQLSDLGSVVIQAGTAIADSVVSTIARPL